MKTGVLPPGLSFNPVSGAFSGVPTAAGNFSFEVVVTDSSLHDEGSQTFVIDVGNVGGGSGNVKVSVSPTSATLLSGETQQFTATVTEPPIPR